MTGMNTGLAQLALLLHGLGRSGFGNQYNLPNDPNSTGPQSMANSWAANPGFHAGGGSHLPITPAQEFLLGPMSPAWEIPFEPEWASPIPEYFPLPNTGPLPPDIAPPFIPPQAIPYEDDISKYEPDEPVSEIPDDPECAAEWAWALEQCGKEFLQLRKRRTGEHKYFNHDRCAKGYVSERCGGNALDHRPEGPPPLQA
jgi:hypothetical protein